MDEGEIRKRVVMSSSLENIQIIMYSFATLISEEENVFFLLKKSPISAFKAIQFLILGTF